MIFLQFFVILVLWILGGVFASALITVAGKRDASSKEDEAKFLRSIIK